PIGRAIGFEVAITVTETGGEIMNVSCLQSGSDGGVDRQITIADQRFVHPGGIEIGFPAGNSAIGVDSMVSDLEDLAKVDFAPIRAGKNAVFNISIGIPLHQNGLGAISDFEDQ